jgi:hypothetical protein
MNERKRYALDIFVEDGCVRLSPEERGIHGGNKKICLQCGFKYDL